MSEVTQADREAAARWSRSDIISAEIEAGHVDDLPLVQAFARHREEAAKEARIAVLREAEQTALEIAAKLEGDYLHSRSAGIANQKIAANRVAAAIHVLWNEDARKRRAAFREAYPHLCSGEKQ